MPNTMETMLVTGANGFIGSHLVEVLISRGQRVRCLVRPTSKLDDLEHLDVEFFFGDVLDADSVNRAVPGNDVVFHAVRTDELSGCRQSGNGLLPHVRQII